MNNNKIINTCEPKEDNEVVNLKYLKEYGTNLLNKINENKNIINRNSNKINSNKTIINNNLMFLKNELKKYENYKTETEKKFIKIELDIHKGSFDEGKLKEIENKINNDNIQIKSILNLINKTQSDLKNDNSLKDLETKFNELLEFKNKTQLKIKQAWAINDYKIFNEEIKPHFWYSFWKSLIYENFKFQNLLISTSNHGHLMREFTTNFQNNFSIVLVADKHYYEKNGIVNFGTKNKYHVFGWYNKYRNYNMVDGIVSASTPTVKYEGTDIIFLRYYNSYFYYNSEEIFVSICKQNQIFEFKFNPSNIKFYEIIFFYKFLEPSEMKKIEIFMKKMYPNILYNVKF